MKWIWNKIKEEKFIILFLAILGMLRSMHEIAKFRASMSWLPEWDYLLGIRALELDSYHFFGGLFVLVLITGLRLKLRPAVAIVNRRDGKGDYIELTEIAVNRWWQTILIVIVEMYAVYFWVFDWFYHVIFMKPEFIQWDYVIPFLSLFKEVF